MLSVNLQDTMTIKQNKDNSLKAKQHVSGKHLHGKLNRREINISMSSKGINIRVRALQQTVMY